MKTKPAKPEMIRTPASVKPPIAQRGNLRVVACGTTCCTCLRWCRGVVVVVGVVVVGAAVVV